MQNQKKSFPKWIVKCCFLCPCIYLIKRLEKFSLLISTNQQKIKAASTASTYTGPTKDKCQCPLKKCSRHNNSYLCQKITMASCSYQPNKHSPPKTLIRFFKIILRQSLQDGNLKIPNKFTSKYGGGVKNPVYLKPPDGTQWKVQWTQHDGDILFEKGWKEFAAYYSLDHGHLLRFEFNGTSCFEVHIFDMSGLEIHYPFNNRIDNDSVETLNELPPQCWGREQKRLKTPLSLSLPFTSKQLRIATETRDVEGGSQPEEKNIEMPIIPSVIHRSDVFEPGTCGFRCLEEAQKFNSENPSFMIKLGKSNLQRSRAVSLSLYIYP
ncbi:hypothetical protein HN51_060753 [Arachis hypogaea]